jgi:hypothetical protein
MQVWLLAPGLATDTIASSNRIGNGHDCFEQSYRHWSLPIPPANNPARLLSKAFPCNLSDLSTTCAGLSLPYAVTLAGTFAYL